MWVRKENLWTGESWRELGVDRRISERDRCGQENLGETGADRRISERAMCGQENLGES